MFKVERIRRIKEILTDCKQIDVGTLSGLLSVSDATIRNDFEELEREGFLTRFHGGATLNATQTAEELHNPFTGTAIKYDKNKEELGEIAVRLVRDGEWIFIGPGTTSYYIAKALLSRSGINVLTNNFLVASVLSANSSIQVLFIGGRLNCAGFYSFPDNIEAELQDVHLDKCFFSVDGVDMDGGYTLSDWSIQELITSIAAKSEKILFVIDCSKFNKRSFRRIGDLDYPDILVTNDNIPTEFKTYYLEHRVCTYTSYDLDSLHL
ncbi:DeoR/GlpR family DNA-binding transcription regulator [Hespellia stercorisuis]|uniref:Transcriptional regulator, DeoR family n=1 Tax=Hespellia stercorisuis DSM 15480 TaxID=1121950 RepID=A0A1M6RCU4_9FIRM|nr:DeoR/GlpR family DNA-binding transcription regulator [Hespellia stercorisuis]SHK30220.1 transcriptional regulator, DeoR family [Hespellia stercorisuis DSM 15480]